MASILEQAFGAWQKEQYDNARQKTVNIENTFLKINVQEILSNLTDDELSLINKVKEKVSKTDEITFNTDFLFANMIFIYRNREKYVSAYSRKKEENPDFDNEIRNVFVILVSGQILIQKKVLIFLKKEFKKNKDFRNTNIIKLSFNRDTQNIEHFSKSDKLNYTSIVHSLEGNIRLLSLWLHQIEKFLDEVDEEDEPYFYSFCRHFTETIFLIPIDFEEVENI